MHLKLKRAEGRGHGMQPRFNWAAAVSLTLVACLTGLGVAFAGPAAAYNSVRLCVTYGSTGSTVYCALEGSGKGANVTLGYGSSGSGWNSPNAGDKGQISLAESSPALCLEIQTSKSDQIIEENCKGHSTEEWNVAFGDTVFGNLTVPAYVYQSAYNSKLCLAAPAKHVGPLYAKPCKFSSQTQNWMQCQLPGFCSATS